VSTITEINFEAIWNNIEIWTVTVSVSDPPTYTPELEQLL